MSFSKVGACALTTLAYFCSPLAVEAAQLTYTPVNPSFGGNPGNSAHLLSVANGQNNYAPPAATPASASQTQATQFLQQLQSRFLSALASNVTEAIFGDNPQSSGEIVFGSQTIRFDRGLDAVAIDIFDATTGQTTTISVPVLLTGR
ncbi:MAG: curli assembly protein CsgF [Phenylobacterium sp.]|uniref:curli assembly protein CsgF n=1 Tax=Phenylobacterium sp. TaxID=1871053 RepID=UPI002715F5C2|nr:curli assembly protein CsgF [Phenylobacterium sp.]MDO8802371.1 curli assembly protein CsgF [Phenylobacterium sp.]MDO9247624.1 curli assembly protein CsgF [Phenylobacterium sp.]MDP2011533.1 curli assembly protein CsgF [Phenylobacterium sp.]MDP3632681.1 curli assembly protein CsgF [Phenylobacterium sp.]MDP3868849.1 curli assembly protein CsgF [Phenylobacterium sp.]